MPLEAKKIASSTPTVSTSPRAVPSTFCTSLASGVATWVGQASSRICATSLASSMVPKYGASAATRIRNGNSDISAESAMWLAIAQPSSALKRENASRAIW